MIKTKKFFDKPNGRSLTKISEMFEYEDECVEEGEDDVSTQFLRIGKIRLI